MWEIYAYGNIETLWLVFNGVAMLMNSDDYFGLIRVIALFAFLAIFVATLTTGRFEGLKWFMSMMIMYMVMFVPRVEVVLVDRLALDAPRNIANVPIGLAFFGHATSKIGDFLTRSFEAVYAGPDTLRYGNSGLLFGHKIIENALLAEFVSSGLERNLNRFYRDCALYDLSDGTINADTLKNASLSSGGMWAVLAGTNNARLTIYNNAVTGCRDAYNRLTADITGDLPSVFEKVGQILNPQRPAAVASALFQGQLVDTNQVYVNVATTADAIMRQALVVNSFKKNGAFTAVEMNDPAATMLNLSTAQTILHTKNAYRTMADVMKETLPLIRNTIEVIIYAVFPFTFLMLLLPIGTALMALKAFVTTLMWLQLWAPLYAILNMVMTTRTGQTLPAKMNGNNLSLDTVSSMANVIMTEMDIAGYMVISIPIIAMMIVKGGEMALTSVASHLTQPSQGAAMQTAGGITSGVLAYNKVDTNKHDTVPISRSGDGFAETVGAQGAVRFTRSGELVGAQMYQSTVGATAQTGFAVSRGLERAASSSLDSGYSSLRRAQETQSGGRTSSTDFDYGNSIEGRTMSSLTEKIQKSVKNATGREISTQQAQDLAYGFSAGIGGQGSSRTSSGSGVPASPAGLAATVVMKALGVRAGLDVSGKESQQEREALSRIEQEVKDILRSHDISSSKALVDTIRKTESYQELQASRSDDAVAAEANFRKSDSLRDQASSAASASASGTVDQINNFVASGVIRINGPEDMKRFRDDPRALEEAIVKGLSGRLAESPFQAVVQQRNPQLFERLESGHSALAAEHKENMSSVGNFSEKIGPVGQVSDRGRTEYQSGVKDSEVGQLRNAGVRISAERGNQNDEIGGNVSSSLDGPDSAAGKISERANVAVEGIERDGIGAAGLVSKAKRAISSVTSQKDDDEQK